MNKYSYAKRACLTAAVIACVFSVAYAHAAIDNALFERLARSVLKLHIIDRDGLSTTGTAVVVARETVVTACHVIKDAAQVQLAAEGRKFQVTQAARDIEHDLCLLAVPQLNASPVARGSALKLRPGEPVAAAGFAFGGDLHLMSGVVEAVYDHDRSRMIQVTTEFLPGDSGGGVFNEFGELIAIAAFILGDADAAYFALPVDWLPDLATSSLHFSAIKPERDARPFYLRPMAQLPYFLQAARHLHYQRWDALLQVTELWLKAEPENTNAWQMHGEALAGKGEFVAAARALETAVALDPHSPPALVRLGLAYARRGQIDELQRVLRSLVKRTQGPPQHIVISGAED
jgi:serine protease Do